MTGVGDFAAVLEQSVARGDLSRLVFSRPLAGSEAPVRKVTIRPVVVRDTTVYQWAERRGAQEFHENLSPADLLTRVTSAFPESFGDATLTLPGTQSQFTRLPNGKVRRRDTAVQVSQASKTHDRQKNRLIPEGVPCPFLERIGVMTSDGRVRAAMQHKFRQINRYLEFVDDVLGQLPAEGKLHVVDFGCGKSYLTFAVHYLLTTLRGRTVRLVGIDRKATVIEDCRQIATSLRLDGIEFFAGNIADHRPDGPVHLAISLHACDTATDDALATALAWSAQAILAAPCCQHEIANRLPADTLPGLNGFGIFKERFASLATDALRARFLESRGYRTQVLEFIDLEHTAKNLLIRAVRRKASSETDSRGLAAYQQLKQDLRIDTFHLEAACERLGVPTR